MTWIDPKSLSGKLSREAIKYAVSYLNARIEIKRTGRIEKIRGIKMMEVSIKYEGNEDLLKAAGIEFKNKETFRFVDVRILADITEKLEKLLPIGFIEGKIEHIVSVNWPNKVWTNSIDMAIVMAKELAHYGNVLWIDNLGYMDPLDNGFEEIDGLPLNKLGIGKIEDLAYEIAKLYNLKGKESNIINSLRNENLLQDVEFPMIEQVDDLINYWRILKFEGDLPRMAYIDANGVPDRALQVLIKAAIFGEIFVVVSTDKNIDEKVILLSDKENDATYKIIKLGESFYIRRNLKWDGEIIAIEEQIKPIWLLLEEGSVQEVRRQSSFVF